MATPESLRNPQFVPNDHAYIILQDYGLTEGGWGPALVTMPWQSEPRPFVYTGTDENVLDAAARVCRAEAQATGRTTKLVRFSGFEDVFSVGGSS